MNRDFKAGDIVVLAKGRSQSREWPLRNVVKLKVIRVEKHMIDIVITLESTTRAIFQSGDTYKSRPKRTGDIISVRKSSFNLASDFNGDSYEIF